MVTDYEAKQKTLIYEDKEKKARILQLESQQREQSMHCAQVENEV